MKQTVTRFGAAIRRERVNRSLSNRELARATGISAPYMHQMEVNDFTPDPEYVVRLARFFKDDPAKWLRMALPDQFKLWRDALRSEVM